MMRTFICLIISCGIIGAVSAQNDDFEATMRSGFFTASTTILPLDNGETIIVGDKYESGGWGNNTLRLDKFDASGNLIWTKTYPDYVFFYYLMSVAVGTDNSIYLTMYRGGCDYFIDSIIMKFDSDGNVVGTYTTGYPFDIYRMEPNANGGFWAQSSNELIEYDSNFDTIQIVTVPTNISSFDYDIPSGDFVVYSSSDEILRYLAADGNNQEINLPTSLRVDFWGNDIMVRYSNKIQRYDKQLNLINSIDLPASYSKAGFNDEYIYLSDNSYNEPNQLLKLNQNLEIIDSMTWQYGRIRDIDVVNDYLYVLGDDYEHSYLKTTNKDFDYTDINTDIGVVEIIGAMADSTCYSPYYCPNCQYDVTGIKAVVQNFGTETINYFELNAFYENECLGICADYQPTMMIYDNVDIAPGEVDTVDFPDIYIWNQYIGTQMCLYTTRPNQLLDKNRDNDNLCGDFIYDETIVLDEVEAGLEFSIFPNPASDIINLQNTQIDWQKATVNIINIEGRQIPVQAASQIDISALPAGVYVIKCEYGGAKGSKRFVKYK